MTGILSALWLWNDNRDFVEEFVWQDQYNYWKCFSNKIYNQDFVDRYSCTSSAAIWCISDVTGLQEEVDDPTAINWTMLTLSFRKKAWQRQLETGAIPGRWDYVQNWVKQAVKLFNEEFPELDYYLAYYRIDDLKDFSKVISILNNGSSIVTGYTSSMYADAQDNGRIDNNDNKDGWGHCIRWVKAWVKKGVKYIKYCDNYQGKNPLNVIEVPNIEDNKDFFKWGYYIKKIQK